MTTNSSENRDNERGASLVIIAIMMPVFLIFVGLSIDVGQMITTRRSAQSAADLAALAGVQDLPNTTAAIQTVKTMLNSNLGVEDADWVGCTDSEALALVPDVANSNTCISMDMQMEKIRVFVPPVEVETIFASAVTDHIDISASAVARLNPPEYSTANTVPFAITMSAGTGNLCIENGGRDAACASKSSGNFGAIFGPRANSWVSESSNDLLVINSSLGGDHQIEPYISGSKLCNGYQTSPCDARWFDDTSLIPNHLTTETGNTVPPVTDGLVTGKTVWIPAAGSDFDFCGRLARPDRTVANAEEPTPAGGCNPGGPTMEILRTTINGRHIYHWMAPTARTIFYPEVSHDVVLTDSSYAAGDVRLNCFLTGYTYNPFTGAQTIPDCSAAGLNSLALFTGTTLNKFLDPKIIDDPRFVVIPAVDSWGGGGSDALEILGFRTAYLYNLHTSRTAVKGVDAWLFDWNVVAPTSFGNGGGSSYGLPVELVE